ncbi:uncharacterized protein Z519_01851 [Cladophialophora bantiana CBS 173.52]|uniref:CoA carboxyltransferase C-terminal domain-containing protein n=1 Tax=Cladophialophora bantiana (strain ATCC 10958 / CBS 173.52 / CDC B-1940 / NIH 8579) TaxID=1442370 RepID=A0A0D2GIQ6_CLAB1|nr:uncharacterized protein Z519_01851 [Cladophialophora bantiana CBS 173.52]KIW98267.1 hypothetical protein Z519_01851 [Cladophialophora bantiana CBS 173.52]
MVKLVDGSSGGGSITTYKTDNGSFLPEIELLPFMVRQLNLGISNCAAVVGPAVGLGAARAAVCHFSVMVGDIGALFNAGPKIVEGTTFEEGFKVHLGGPSIHCGNGVVDNYAPNEKGCYDQVAQFLTYVPNHGGILPPVTSSSNAIDRDCSSLRSSIPRRRQRMYQVRTIIRSIVDKYSFFEIGPHWGRSVVVGLARMNGRPVGIVVNNCMVNAGAMDAAGCQKLSKHLRLCDVMGLPLVQLIDIPGFAIGTAAEESRVMKWAMDLCKTYFTNTISIFSVIMRRCYGVGGVILIDNRESNCRVAWPSLNSGSVPLDGGIEDLRKVRDKAQELYKHLEAEYTNLQHPLRVSSKFGVEEVIDQAHTRIIDTLKERLQERSAGKIKPSFR